MALAIDHVFAMVEPDGDWAARAASAGWVLDDGIEHEGQGTRNRRLWWPEQYLEFLWIASRRDAEQNPLRLDRRADWATTGACPFGIGLRGPLTDDERAQFWAYEPPYAQGAHIWIHRDNEADPEQPFVFAFDAAPEIVERYLPRNRLAATPHLLAHRRPGALRAIDLALPRSPPPILDGMTPPVRWRAGRPHLDIVVGDGDDQVELTELVSLRG